MEVTMQHYDMPKEVEQLRKACELLEQKARLFEKMAQKAALSLYESQGKRDQERDSAAAKIEALEQEVALLKQSLEAEKKAGARIAVRHQKATAYCMRLKDRLKELAVCSDNLGAIRDLSCSCGGHPHLMFSAPKNGYFFLCDSLYHLRLSKDAIKTKVVPSIREAIEAWRELEKDE
jgi:hypothetical protein